MAVSVALLGDLVGSRTSADRRGLHDRLTAALEQVSASIPPLHRLAVTAGDEFQGTYATVGEAVATALALRVRLEPAAGARFGIGRGDVTVLNATTNTQDGPGWWAARAAIEHVSTSADDAGWAALRTAYRSADESDPLLDAVNAALVCQDLLLDSYDERSWSILRGMMAEKTQTQIAQELGITRQAVQQRRSSGGMPMLLSSAQHLARLP